MITDLIGAIGKAHLMIKGRPIFGLRGVPFRCLSLPSSRQRMWHVGGDYWLD